MVLLAVWFLFVSLSVIELNLVQQEGKSCVFVFFLMCSEERINACWFIRATLPDSLSHS